MVCCRYAVAAIIGSFPVFAFGQNRQIAVPGDVSVRVGGLGGILNPLAGSGQQVFGFQNQTFQRRFQQRFPDFRRKGQIFAQGDTSAVVRQGKQTLRDDQPQAGKHRGCNLQSFREGKDVDDAGKRFRHGACMHGGIGRRRRFPRFPSCPAGYRDRGFPR